MEALKLTNIVKEFGSVRAVDELSVTVESGEFFSILGPSGCGKTTTLRCITGFEKIDSGSVELNEEEVTNSRPAERDINMVFQGYALFPHKTVGENIEFGLKLDNVKKTERQKRVEEILETVSLPGMQDRKPEELSGGQQQRVALARALVLEPSILALDEPLASLDRKLRQELRYELKQLQNELGVTTIYVTHDQREAMALSDRMMILRDGSPEQIGTPAEIYNHPKNRFVANFIGESNIFENGETDSKMVEKGTVSPSANGKLVTDTETETDDPVVVRPEDIKLVNQEDANLIGEVQTKTFHGNNIKYIIEAGDKEIIAEVEPNIENNPEAGETVGVTWNSSDTTVLSA